MVVAWVNGCTKIGKIHFVWLPFATHNPFL